MHRAHVDDTENSHYQSAVWIGENSVVLRTHQPNELICATVHVPISEVLLVRSSRHLAIRLYEAAQPVERDKVPRRRYRLHHTSH